MSGGAPRRTVLVTGASSGIGAACARLLARQGYDVAVHYGGNRAGAESVSAEVRAAGGVAHLVQADVADAGAVAEMYRALDRLFPRLDALVNNAGIVAEAAPVAQMAPERIAQIFGVNAVGAFVVAREAARRMEAQGSGAMVNISSAAARLASPNQYVDYAASKAAVDILTKGLAEELAPQGVRVNGIRPGIIETEIHAKGGQPKRAAQLAPSVPMRRSGSAEEVAEAVAWLLSDAASYVTGATLDVTGGR